MKRNASHYTGKRKWQHIGTTAAAVGARVRDFAPDAWSHPAVDAGSFCRYCDAWKGCLGLEPTFQLYVNHLVSVFKEVRRVLRGDGTLWLNLGDCYHNGDKGGYRAGRVSRDTIQAKHMAGDVVGAPNREPQKGLKPKDLVGIPWRVALALQAGSWWLRSDIVWAKPNPMPESVRDRPTRSHEYVFLLSKSERYFYDADAIREPLKPDTVPRYHRGRSTQHKWANGGPADQTIGKSLDHMARKYRSGNLKRFIPGAGERGRLNTHLGSAIPWQDNGLGRNRRSVWTFPTQPFKGAHFATFPERLVEPCIQASTSAAGCCARCGRPWLRVTEQRPPPAGWLRQCGSDSSGSYAGRPTKDYERAGAQNPNDVKVRILAGLCRRVTTKWRAGCTCRASCIPCTVLDPFAGSGTTGVVAARLGCRFIGIELSGEYVRLAQGRIRGSQSSGRTTQFKV